jgi:hypothetical protein
MSKIFKVVVINPANKLEEIITESAKSIQQVIRKLETRNLKVKRIIGEE